MRTRHRIPTIFNLSMVDVLCCALGCVILLWLVNFREAKRKAGAAEQTSVQLADTRTELTASRKEAVDLNARLRTSQDLVSRTQEERDSARAMAEAAGQERDRLQAELALARKRMVALSADLAGSRVSAAALKDQVARADRRALDLARQISDLTTQGTAQRDLLARKGKEAATLTDERDTARKKLEEQLRLMRDKETQLTTTNRNASDLADRLRLAEVRVKDLKSLADLVPGQKRDAESLRGKLVLAEGKVVSLEKSLTTEKARANQAVRARAVAENRFAGIALTGKKVIFLVDMSGSMDFVDDNTRSPGKWQGVRDTLVKLIASLPDLERFQVILFADKVSYPLGSEGTWVRHDSRSVHRVKQALADVKPKGSTNMHIALEAAFRYRSDGLDTIYLLSDGLPNIGPGLTPEQRKLKEAERSEILGQSVRKTLRTDWNRTQPGKPRVRINAVGFFFESPAVGAFLWALSRENDGSFVGMSKP